MTCELIPQVVMTLCRGYDIVGGEYVASRETRGRANAAFDYYDRPGRVPYQDTSYLFSGWYGKVASRGHMPEPPEGVSEAVLAEGVFTEKIENVAAMHAWDTSRVSYWEEYCQPQTAIDGKSTDTFTNFTESIDAGYLTIGAFSADSPLVLSTSKAHSWRSGVIAEQALAPEPNSLLILPPTGYETGPIMTMRERVLHAFTRLALADVGEVGGAQPGNLAHTKAAAQAFEEMTKAPVPALRRALRYRRFWVTPEVPILRY